MPNTWKRFSEEKIAAFGRELPEGQIEATETEGEAVAVSKEPKAVIPPQLTRNRRLFAVAWPPRPFACAIKITENSYRPNRVWSVDAPLPTRTTFALRNLARLAERSAMNYRSGVSSAPSGITQPRQ